MRCPSCGRKVRLTKGGMLPGHRMLKAVAAISGRIFVLGACCPLSGCSFEGTQRQVANNQKEAALTDPELPREG